MRGFGACVLVTKASPIRAQLARRERVWVVAMDSARVESTDVCVLVATAGERDINTLE